MSKLSPALKSLINAAHSRPGPVPAPPRIQAVYQRIQEEATERKLGRPSWLGISTAATMTMNSPESMIALYNSTSASRPSDEGVQIAEFMREIGLKCIGFNGIPRTINMLNAFRANLPPSIASSLNTQPTRNPSPENIESINQRGRVLWDAIYRPLETKLIDKLGEAHPDLPVFIINQEYGGLFTDPPGKPGAKVGRVTTSLIAITCLRAQQGVGPQVLSHVFGLRKGWDDGTWKQEPEAGSEEAIKWLVSDEGCTWVLEKVDELVAALGGGEGTTRAKDLAYNPDHARWIIPLLLVADAALCGVVIDKVPYTEIDWSTYMQQIAIYLKGERDYTKISGSTGPLVYPGAHVWIYKYLYWLTDEGRDVKFAQYIFALVYLGTLGVVALCYRRARVPPYIFPLLILSKRMHSIFVLRCFNDCFAVLGLFAAIFCYQRDQWHLGSFFFATGLNVKMSLLLPLPAMGVLMIQKLGSRESFTQGMIIFQTTVLFGYPFRKQAFSYFGRAFELSRAFLYKWTVNWRFVPEETFLSKPFAISLLAAHASLLILFGVTRWLKPSKRSPRQFLKIIMPQAEPRDQDVMAKRVTPNFASIQSFSMPYGVRKSGHGMCIPAHPSARRLW
ncbi:Dol-P-Man:Man(5)GlcNAc(2)-PP-Dol alpha-1,3-mannosyltransferase [Ophiobolus disseminans]|uniref:Dol-P-Man:Man(5)GlcNAc(2)-PP-Dol alpha-1,3-mannosyltransferase n=1 Tax=Ophiobolus disseminans TaxID=1469910 RepID=A0A6A7AA40_9PLEO|nr:Dol-P-Man:Man(5)GlcNAc(2)-PP-Dol alpha-1,3-mannosyltransferase [Ophiobolus disseminans]